MTAATATSAPSAQRPEAAEQVKQEEPPPPRQQQQAMHDPLPTSAAAHQAGVPTHEQPAAAKQETPTAARKTKSTDVRSRALSLQGCLSSAC